MDYRLEPDEPNADELWVEQRADELLELPLEELIQYPWFKDCIQWEDVLYQLREEAYAELQFKQREEEISRWETEQQYQQEYYL